jgi:hypothetical protein
MNQKEALAKWIADNASNIDGGYLTEHRGLGAERIIRALHDAGFVIIRDRTDPEGGIPGRGDIT